MHTHASHRHSELPALELREVHVHRDGTPVLRGVNLTIPQGEVVALIGPNGSGKTTLLRAVLGLEKVVKGQISYFGGQPGEPVLQRIGYVPQRFQPHGSFILSVREFLALRLKETQGWFWMKKPRIDDAIARSSSELNLKELLDRPLHRLSGGQMQRVLIAFSLLHNPDLLLLDEPTAGVDSPGEASFYEFISQIHEHRKMTVVLVSHDLAMVYKHASWVYALNGVVCCEGKPEEIMNEDSLKRAYGIHMSPYHHMH